MFPLGNANPPSTVVWLQIAGRWQRTLRPIGSQAAGPLSLSLPFPPRAARQGAASGPYNRPLKGHADSVAHVKLRPRLLVVSLLIAAIISVGLGWVIARGGTDSSSANTVIVDDTNGASSQLQPPTIGTNAVVKGDQLPDATVQTLDGTVVSVRSLVGQPLVINVWGSTCVPCQKELPDFAAAHLAFGDQVRFVGISFLGASDREESFARDRGVNYELLYDGDGAFINAMGIAAFPVTLFVNADGVIVRQTGQLNEDSLTSFLESDLL